MYSDGKGMCLWKRNKTFETSKPTCAQCKSRMSFYGLEEGLPVATVLLAYWLRVKRYE